MLANFVVGMLLIVGVTEPTLAVTATGAVITKKSSSHVVESTSRNVSEATKSSVYFAPPTAMELSDSTIAENEAAGTLVGRFSTTDPDPETNFTYTLTTGAGDSDNASFTIEGDSLLSSVVFDYEVDSVYTIRVTTTDPLSESFDSTFTITIDDVVEIVNQPPADITLNNNSIAENQEAGTLIGRLTTTDPDDTEGFVYAVDDNTSFRIEGDSLLSNIVFDFEDTPSYSIQVTTIDPQDSALTKTFTINVTDVTENQPPTDITLDNNSIDENQEVGTLVGRLTTTDPDDAEGFVYTVDDNTSFRIEGDSLLSNIVFDFEDTPSYSIQVTVTDPQDSAFTKAFTIQVVDEADTNQPPTDITLDKNSIAENQPINTPIGKLTTEDPDHTEGFTYTKVVGVGDNDNDAFRIVGDQLSSDQLFDFETQNTYQVRIRATDPAGATFDKAFTVTVTDVDENQAPTAISLDNSSIAENEAEGSLVGKLSTTDPDNSTGFTYSLTAGAGDADNASFSIKNNQLLSAAVFDFEATETYQVRITTSDPGDKTFTEAFTLQVTDVDEIDNLPPTDLTLSNATIAENEPADTEIGSFTVTDPDTEDTHTVTLVEGQGDDDNGRFQIRDNVLFALVSFDFEKRSTYSIRVQGKDPKEATITKILAITVTDTEDNVNQAPTDILLSDTLVNEGQIVNLTVGTFSATDPDPDDTHTFSLVAGEGDNDNAIFSIADGQLQTAQAFDFETQALYRIRVRADDGKGGSLEKMLTIAVIEDSAPENRAPEVANPLADLTTEVGEAFSFVLPDNTFSDADADDVLTYNFSLADGLVLPAWLAYNAANRTLSGTPPEEAPDSLVLVVTATDAQGASVTDQFTLTITRVTALDDERSDTWVVYPVPADQRRITLRTPAMFGTHVQLRLLDTNGRLLRTYRMQKGRSAEYTIELPPTLQAGTYFLEIETSRMIGRKRVLLQ